MTSVPALSAEQRAKLAQRLTYAPSDRGDDGSVLPLTRAALALDAAHDGGAARLEALVAALYSERVVVPVTVESALEAAHLGEEGADGAAHPHGDIDFVRVETSCGPALAVYSSKDTLVAHRPKDRPIAYEASKVCLATLVETGGRLVMDPGGAHILIPRAAVAALAQGDRWLPAWKDAELLAEVRAAAGLGTSADDVQVPGGAIADVRMSYAGQGGVRIDLFIRPDADAQAARAAVTQAAQRIAGMTRLGVAAERVEVTPRLAAT